MDSPKKEIRILKKVKKDEHEQCRIHGRMPYLFHHQGHTKTMG